MRKLSSIALLLCIFCLALQCIPVAWSADTPGAYIRGYVLDEDGNRVPHANVSLWQDGRMWQLTKYIFSGTENPQVSGISYSMDNIFPGEGGFLFGFVYPGDYILTAEKDGYNGTAVVNVNGSTMRTAVIVPQEVPMNITLNGYHLPGLPSELQNYTGTITGNIRTGSGYKASGVNISLWKNGELVKRSDNPQASFPRNYSGVEVDYLFEHLEPGNYTIMATYHAGGKFTDSVNVSVSTQTMRADIIMSQMLDSLPNYPIESFSPTVGEFSPYSEATSAKPTPATPWLITLLIIGSAVYVLWKKGSS